MLMNKVNRDDDGLDYKRQKLILLCDTKFVMKNILRKEGGGKNSESIEHYLHIFILCITST